MAIGIVRSTLVFGTVLCGNCLLCWLVWASSSITSARAVTDDGKQWIVEISRSSVSHLRASNVDPLLKATLKRISIGFEERTTFDIDSAGYYWYAAKDREMCSIFAIVNANLDHDQELATIENDPTDRRTCKQNARALKKAVEHSRQTAYIERKRRQMGVSIVSNAELTLVKTILSWGEAIAENGNYLGDLRNIEMLPTITILTKGYVVQEGETLSSIAHKVTGDASYWSKMRVFHEGSGQYALDANTIYPEDRVYFEPSLSSRYMASSLPGYMYSTTKLTAISDIVADQFSYEADYDSVIAGALIAGNQHVIQEMGRTAEVPTGKSVWIPQVVVGWQEIELSDSDPLSIAETVYGNERYELLVATICPSHHVENVGRCILPVLSVPEVTMGYWDVLNDTGVDVQQRFSKIKMHEQTD